MNQQQQDALRTPMIKSSYFKTCNCYIKSIKTISLCEMIEVNKYKNTLQYILTSEESIITVPLYKILSLINLDVNIQINKTYITYTPDICRDTWKFLEELSDNLNIYCNNSKINNELNLLGISFNSTTMLWSFSGHPTTTINAFDLKDAPSIILHQEPNLIDQISLDTLVDLTNIDSPTIQNICNDLVHSPNELTNIPERTKDTKEHKEESKIQTHTTISIVKTTKDPPSDDSAFNLKRKEGRFHKWESDIFEIDIYMRSNNIQRTNKIEKIEKWRSEHAKKAEESEELTLYTYDENRLLYTILFIKNKIEERIILHEEVILVPYDKGITYRIPNENVSKEDLEVLLNSKKGLRLKSSKTLANWTKNLEKDGFITATSLNWNSLHARIDKIQKCFICNETFESKKADKHILVGHFKSTLSCSLCHGSYSNILSGRRHLCTRTCRFHGKLNDHLKLKNTAPKTPNA